MTTNLIALLDSDPAAGILAAADLREQVNSESRRTDHDRTGDGYCTCYGLEEPARDCGVGAHRVRARLETRPAAEANPAHARAAVRRWRGVVERHEPVPVGAGVYSRCMQCASPQSWPCPDLTETADEVRAYLGGAL